MPPCEGGNQVGHDLGIDVCRHLAARLRALDHPAGMGASSFRIVGERRSGGLVGLRFGDKRPEDIAGRSVAPVREQIHKETGKVLLELAGIRHLDAFLPLVDLDQQRRLARPPAINGRFPRSRPPRDGLDRKAGIAGLRQDRFGGLDDGIGAFRVSPGADRFTSRGRCFAHFIVLSR